MRTLYTRPSTHGQPFSFPRACGSRHPSRPIQFIGRMGLETHSGEIKIRMLTLDEGTAWLDRVGRDSRRLQRRLVRTDLLRR